MAELYFSYLELKHGKIDKLQDSRAISRGIEGEGHDLGGTSSTLIFPIHAAPEARLEHRFAPCLSHIRNVHTLVGDDAPVDSQVCVDVRAAQYVQRASTHAGHWAVSAEAKAHRTRCALAGW